MNNILYEFKNIIKKLDFKYIYLKIIFKDYI